MNNENNNLNGVVLGNVSNEKTNPNTQSVDQGNTIMNNNPGSVVMPESNVINPAPQVVTNQNVSPQVSASPVIPQEQVINPQPTNDVNTSQNIQQSVNETVPIGQTITGQVNNEPAPQGVSTPQPAYTNINTINPIPRTDNNIGTNPPISLENDKAPKKKGNSTLFVIVIIILLLAVALGTYYVLNYTDLLSKKESITVSTNNLIYNVGEKLSDNIDDYASIKGTSSNNCTFNTNNVDTSKEGIYKYTVTCSNVTKEGNITIIDNTEFFINTKTVYHVKGEAAEAKEFVKNITENVNYSFVDENDVNSKLNGEIGKYTVKIKATSDDGKEATADATLVITQYKIKGYISCTSKEQTIENYVMEKTNRFAIIEDGNNGFGNIGFEIYTFRFENSDDYQKIVSDFNANGKITINNISGVPEFDEENNKVVIINEVESTDLYGTYGTDNLKDYSSIRTYFTQNLNYNCSYEKVNA